MNKLSKLVINKSLCTGCGTCVAICPRGAITIIIDSNDIYTPRINNGLCNHCDICLNCCPGHYVNYAKIQSESKHKYFNRYIGYYENGYGCYSNDAILRYNGSSGGLVTTLLKFGLEENMFDGALVTGTDRNTPWQPKPFIARSIAEVVEASGSKYCPAPSNIALKEVLSSEGRYAIVGLPCHIHSIRNAMRIIKPLREKIAFTFGLFCASGRSFRGLKTLLKQLSISEDEIVNLRYRGKGWPGYLSIKLKDNRTVEIPLEHYYPFMCLHDPYRCSLCPDKSSELADISFGDLWLPEERVTNGSGKSVCITRSNKGQALFERAMMKGYISALQLSEQNLIRAVQPENKKKLITSRLHLCRLFLQSVPVIRLPLDSATLLNYFQSAKYYFVQNACKNDLLLWFYLTLRKKYRKSISVYRAL